MMKTILIILTIFVICHGFALISALGRIANSLTTIAMALNHLDRYLKTLDNLRVPEEFINVSYNIRQHLKNIEEKEW